MRRYYRPEHFYQENRRRGLPGQRAVRLQAVNRGILTTPGMETALPGVWAAGDETERAGIYTSLLRNRVPLESIDYALIRENPSLLPFGSDYRGKKLGGVV